MVKDITQLVESYFQAFVAGDAEKITGHWDYPCQVSAPGLNRVFHTPAQFLNNFNALSAFYQDIGLQLIDSKLIEIRKLSDTAAIVRVRDRYTLKDGAAPGLWEFVFVVRSGRTAWKISSAIMDDEIKSLLAWGYAE